MNIDNYNEYYKYKIKTVYQYSILLSKIIGLEKNKFWHKKKDIETSLEFIINDYFDRIYSDIDKDLVRCFIQNKDIFKYNIDRELYSVVNYFIENGRAFEIKIYEKEIILSAIVVYIANKLDVSTSPYMINKNNYKTILLNYLEKFNKSRLVSIIDDGKKNMNVLLELVKSNVKKERKIYELLNSNISLNKYIDISKENIYYISQYNYSVPNIKDVDKGAVSYIFDKDNYDNKFTLISMDLVIVTFMKLLSVRKFNKMFFIPVKSKFLLSDSLNKVKALNKNKYLKRNINLLINFDDLSEEIVDKIDMLDVGYYVYASKNTNVSYELDSGYNYLVSNDFYVKYKEMVDVVSKNTNVIIESFDGLVTDRIIAEEG